LTHSLGQPCEFYLPRPGEIALLFDTPRNASIKAATRCELMVLGRESLHKVSALYPLLHERLVRPAPRARA
jgi:CRP-like cAMP-binding protein